MEDFEILEGNSPAELKKKLQQWKIDNPTAGINSLQYQAIGTPQGLASAMQGNTGEKHTALIWFTVPEGEV